MEEIFGKGGKFRTTNTKLHLGTRIELIDLYDKIYGTCHVTNNEFMEWQVKGYIVVLCGQHVNWAEAAAATARSKLDCAQHQLLRLDAEGGGTSSGFRFGSKCFGTDPSGFSGQSVGRKGGGQRSLSCLSRDPSDSIVLIQGKKNVVLQTSICPYGVSSQTMAEVHGVLQYHAKLLDRFATELQHLPSEHKKTFETLIGLRFSIEDRCAAAKEAQESFNALECELQTLTEEHIGLEKQVRNQGFGSQSAS